MQEYDWGEVEADRSTMANGQSRQNGKGLLTLLHRTGGRVWEIGKIVPTKLARTLQNLRAPYRTCAHPTDIDPDEQFLYNVAAGGYLC